MLSIDRTALLIIDVQEKLARVMADKESLITNLQKLVRGTQVMGIPIIYTEQYPKGLGPTLAEIASLLTTTKPLSKMSFSCCGDTDILVKIKGLNRKQFLVAGIEAHVCVYQTVRDLLNMDYEVEVVADCIDSRTKENKKLAIEKMRGLGAPTTSMEMVLFELLKTAEHKNFKDISQIVK